MQFKSTMISALATGGGLAAALSGEEAVAIVTCIINIAVLLVNAGIEIYRKIRDRDADLEDKK